MDVFDLEKAVEWWDRPGWCRLRRRTGERIIKERGVRRQRKVGSREAYLFIFKMGETTAFRQMDSVEGKIFDVRERRVFLSAESETQCINGAFGLQWERGQFICSKGRECMESLAPSDGLCSFPEKEETRLSLREEWGRGAGGLR